MLSLSIDQAMQAAARYNSAELLPPAQAACEQVLRQQPDNAAALHLLGVINAKMGQHQRAIDLLQMAIARQPDWPQAYYHLGNVWKMVGNVDDAIQSYRRAIDLKPDFVKAFDNLGVALSASGQQGEAVAVFEKALALDPTDSIARAHLAAFHSNRGTELEQNGQLDEAEVQYSAALRLNPRFPEAHYNLGNVLKSRGQMQESIAAYRQAIAIKPGFIEAHNNLVYALHFHPDYDSRAIAEELSRWNNQHAAPLHNLLQPHTNDRDPNRRLRIGYVSPDLKEHPIGRFLLPVLTHHDRSQFELFVYAQVPISDNVTQRLKAMADTWRDITALTDVQVADLIRNDRIDVLVDLTMHMARNRLLVFARKPAPVQITWLAYCSSTGLNAMDYRLSDPYLDPHGPGDLIYNEKTIRLPDTYWCYQPILDTGGAVKLAVEPPAQSAGYITFGCLNNFAKVSEPVLAAWTRILAAVPNTRLQLHARPGSHRQLLLDRFHQAGIEAERVQFVGKLPVRDYLQLYRNIDVALDTFPYSGGTTTCDALWMGVPVVTLAGTTAVGRSGKSILSNIGLPELIAGSQQRYIQIATELAGDLPRLNSLRSALRQRMENSGLMNAPRFAHHIENAYRQIWQSWCGGTC